MPVRIDLLLDVRKQTGNVLHLIENRRRRVGFQKTAWIIQRGRLNVRRLQGDIPTAPAEEPLKYRCLPGLARSGQNDGGKLGDGPPEHGFQGTLDVVLHPGSGSPEKEIQEMTLLKLTLCNCNA